MITPSTNYAELDRYIRFIELLQALGPEFFRSIGSGIGETGATPTSSEALTDTAAGLATAQNLTAPGTRFTGRPTTVDTLGALLSANPAGLISLLGRFGMGVAVDDATTTAAHGANFFNENEANLTDPNAVPTNAVPDPGTLGNIPGLVAVNTPFGSRFTYNFGTRPPSFDEPTPEPTPTPDAFFGELSGEVSAAPAPAAPGDAPTGGSSDAAAYHSGGRIPNRGSRRLSEVGIRAMEGEYVVRPESARKYRALLDAINNDDALGIRSAIQSEFMRRNAR